MAENPFFYQFDGSGYTLGAKFDATPESGSANLMNSASIYNTFFGYTTSGKNYSISLDGAGHAYVNVPWTDTNTLTYLKTSSAYTYYISDTITSPTVLGQLKGGTYGAIFSISGAQTNYQGRLYVNTTSSATFAVGGNTVAYVGYNSSSVNPQLLNMCVVVPAQVT